MPPANDAPTPPGGPGKTPRPSKRPRSLAWRAFFTTFKWCRVAVLLLLLTVIVLGLFLNHVGLPGWLERRIEDQFRASGWELKFSKLRLRWYRGIVAEGLQLQRTNTVSGPQLFLQNAEFRLNWQAFRKLDLEANGVLLNGGRLMWPIPGTNQPQRTFVLEQVAGELVFGRNDTWELKFIEADLLNTHIRIRGDITNVSLIRSWKLPVAPAAPSAARTPSDFLHSLLSNAEKVRFEGRPELNVIFSGDASQWRSFDTRLKFTALGLESPWASGTNVYLAIDLLPPPQTNDPVRVDLKATAQYARTPWASATNLDLKFVFEPSFTGVQPTNSLLLLDVLGAETPWGRADHVFAELRSSPSATNAALRETRVDLTVDSLAVERVNVRRARLAATLVHAPDPFLPAAAKTSWTFYDLETLEGSAQWVRLDTALDLPPQAGFRLGETNLTWPARLRNLPFQAGVAFSNTSIARLQLDSASFQARWKFPELLLATTGQLDTGSAAVQATLHTGSREVTFQVDGSLDPMRLARLIATNTPAWEGWLSLTSAPVASVQGRFTLPNLGTHRIDWQREVMPTAQLAGRLETGGGSFRGVPFTAVRLPLTISNSLWTVRDASFRQVGGSLDLNGAGSHERNDFSFALRSDLDLLTLRPALPQATAERIFNWFAWEVPPRLDVTLHGNWTNLAALGLTASATFSNTTFRGQFIHSASAHVLYTNRLVSILSPLVLRKGEWGAADGIALDLATERLYLTNAVGRMLPRVITQAIGPNVDRLIEPYVFENAPDAKTHGVFALNKKDRDDDVRFEVDGGPFRWQRFHLEKVKAVVLWKGDTLAITNVTGQWRGAEVSGSAFFTFNPNTPGDPFSFRVKVEGADLRKILKDLQPDKTNRVEGWMNGELIITSADTMDWKSWQGHGHASMTNGLLWDIPLFGVFSPVFNTVLPGTGLGNNRAREASMTYSITNSVIFTRDLDIRATAMRMNYEGTVDFDQKVDGQMEAELLRDLPAIGFLISKVLWPVTRLFKYDIAGTLNDPRIKERYLIPRALLAPLHPLKTLKELFNFDDGTQPPKVENLPVPPPDKPKSP